MKFRAVFLFLCATVCACFGANMDPSRVSSKHLTLCVAPENGSILEFTGAQTRFNLVAPGSPTDQLGLWQIEPADDKPVITPAQAGRFHCDPLPGPGLRLLWEQFDAAPGLRVEVTVRLDKAQPTSRWHVRLDGLSGLQIHNIHFPRLPAIAAQENEQLAVPSWMGQLASNPRDLLAGPQKRGRRLQWAYPGELSLQCLAWYATPGAGLYLACDDTAAFRKTAAFFADPQGRAGCEWIHLPENTSANSQAWSLPYNVILGTFTGDWITAAERYRAWATNQSWAKQSRLTRRQIPPWVLDTGLWIWNRGRSPGVVDPAIALRQKLGLPVSVFWHWWHGCAYDSGFPEYLPPREGADPFRAAVDRAHDHQIHALVYMNQRLWGMTTASWTNRGAAVFAVKGPDGQIRPEIYNTFTKAPCASMCMGTPFWRNTYASLAEQAVTGLGVDAIYMDQACLSLACYDLAHGHPIGGGRYWVEGFRAMAEDIRARCALPSKPGPLALAGEGCGEPWLPYLDLMLSLQVSRERYAPPDGWETIPFFHAVYHANSVTFGNYSSLTMPPYDDLWPAEFAPKEPLRLLDRKFSRQFMLEQARSFVWGQQPTIANFLPSQLVERTEEIEYLLRLATLRRRATKYLLHGTYLRPPQIDIPDATADMSRLSIYAGQQGGLTTFQKELPLLQTAAWRAPDGTVAIVLASIADEPLPIRFSLDRDYYDLPRRPRITRLDTHGRTDLGRLRARSGEIELTLAGREACVLEVR